MEACEAGTEARGQVSRLLNAEANTRLPGCNLRVTSMLPLQPVGATRVFQLPWVLSIGVDVPVNGHLPSNKRTGRPQ